MALELSNTDRSTIAQQLLAEMPPHVPHMLYDMTDHISLLWARGMTLNEIHAEYETTGSYNDGLREFVHHTYLWLDREFVARTQGAKA